MYTKTCNENGRIIYEKYQSWYDVLLDGYKMSLMFILVGMIGLAITPIMVIINFYRPKCIGSGSVKPQTDHEYHCL